MYVQIAVSCAVVYAGYKLLQSYLQGGKCRSNVKLHGKTVVITGANTGIGKESAEDLCIRGAKVIILCRTESRANAAIADIKSRVPEADIHFYQMDLSSLQSVRDCAERLNKDLDKIDILLNNAGVGLVKYSRTVDDLETITGTNHHGHFLLTNLLLPLLRKAAEGGESRARVVNVSSDAHRSGAVDLKVENQTEEEFSPFKAYCQSKLYNIWFTVELADRERDNGINVYALHPGVIMTEIGRYTVDSYGAFLNFIGRAMMFPFSKTVKNGAQTSIFCCVDESLENKSGKYYTDCREVTPSEAARDRSAAKKLWEVSEQISKLN